MTLRWLTITLLGCAPAVTTPSHYTVRREPGPVAAYCTIAPGPCQDRCGDHLGCVCRCYVDGLTDHVRREIVLAEHASEDVLEHERCHEAGGSEKECE